MALDDVAVQDGHALDINMLVQIPSVVGILEVEKERGRTILNGRYGGWPHEEYREIEPVGRASGLPPQSHHRVHLFP